jgi:hypothetical protein
MTAQNLLGYRRGKLSLRVVHSAGAKRGHRNKTLRHSRASGNPVFISRAQALPGHGYCGRAAPSLPSQALPGTEQVLFLSSGAKQSLPAKEIASSPEPVLSGA